MCRESSCAEIIKTVMQRLSDDKYTKVMLNVKLYILCVLFFRDHIVPFLSGDNPANPVQSCTAECMMLPGRRCDQNQNHWELSSTATSKTLVNSCFRASDLHLHLPTDDEEEGQPESTGSQLSSTTLCCGYL